MATKQQILEQLMSCPSEAQQRELMYRYQEEAARQRYNADSSSLFGLPWQVQPAKPPVAPARDKRILLCPLK